MTEKLILSIAVLALVVVGLGTLFTPRFIMGFFAGVAVTTGVVAVFLRKREA